MRKNSSIGVEWYLGDASLKPASWVMKSSYCFLGRCSYWYAWCLSAKWLADRRLERWVIFYVQHRKRTYSTRPRRIHLRSGYSCIIARHLLCLYGDEDGSVVDLVPSFTHPGCSSCCTMIGREKSRAAGRPKFLSEMIA